MTPLLETKNLTIEYRHEKKWVAAVRDVSLELSAGQTLGLVGESGCGKSTLALSLIGLLPREESRIAAGEIFFDGKNWLGQTPEEWRTVRGTKIAMIFQDPFSSLNPVLTVDYQLREVAGDGADIKRMLEDVQLADPQRILGSYPHQLSGGQRQRVVIAMALARNPRVLIADEPTTALDVTIQDEIVRLLKDLQQKTRMSLIFVSHNLGLVKGVADRIAVMYAGQIVESASAQTIFQTPFHPYTQGLLKSVPTIRGKGRPLPVLPGQPPEPAAIPSGCPFHLRCEKRFDPCDTDDPAERKADSASVRCHLYPRTTGNGQPEKRS